MTEMIHLDIPAFDDAKAEAFAGRMIGVLNDAALALMTSIGHRTGLLDALAANPGVTSSELAARAGVAERYAREWLGVLTTSRVIDYDPSDQSFRLPAEHAAWLTRASANNIAVTAQFVGVAAAVEDEIVARFRDGGGTHYHHYARFHEVMAEDSGQTVVNALIEHILPLVPGLTDRLAAGIDVVDVGCGGGRAMLRLAEAYPASRFTGVDLCADAFAAAERAAKAKGLSNLTFRALDLATVHTLGAFDLVTAFDAVHDQPDPLGLLVTVRNSLRPGGVFLMQDICGTGRLEADIDLPLAPLLYTMSVMHCTPISLGQGGAGLGTMWGVEIAQGMLAQAGFMQVEMTRLPHDIVNAYFVARP